MQLPRLALGLAVAGLATIVSADSGAPCGSDATGAQACPNGEYCQPWNPTFYQCRRLNTATCGVQQTGVDLNGDDLATVQVPLPELCCDKCRSTPGCVAYTFVNYNADGKAYCYLKKGYGTKKAAIGVISAVVVQSSAPAPAPVSGGSCGTDATGAQPCPAGEYCQPWNPSQYQCRKFDTATCGVQQTGVDLYGDDLGTVQVTLPEECCAKCRATSGCKAYTFVNYNADGKAYCYLKKGSGTKKSAVGAVSAVLPDSSTCTGGQSGAQCGSASTGPSCCPYGEYCQPWDPNFYQCRPAPAQCSTQEVGVDYAGNDLERVEGLLPWECCSRCADTYGCKAYTFVNYNSNGKSACYLKSGVGAKSNVAGAVSATVLSPKTAPNAVIKASYTFRGKYAGNFAGAYDMVTSFKSCSKQRVWVNNPVGPLSEEVSMIFRGPIEIYNIAVFDGSAGGDWRKVSSYSQSTGETSNLVFMNNLNIDWTGNRSPQGYATSDGAGVAPSPQRFSGKLAEAKDPNNKYGGPGITTGAEVNIMTGTKCSADGACKGYYSEFGYHGWNGGKKMFVTKVKMPPSNSWPNQPAIWMLNAQVVRANQYGCNCRGMGPVGGCGELDIAEVIETNPARDRVSNHYYFYDGSVPAGADNYAARPFNSATTYVTIFDDSGEGVVKIMEIGESDFDFSASTFSYGQIKAWLNA